MEKVKERVVTGGCVFLVYILFISTLILLNHRVDYIENLSQATINTITVSK